MSDTVPPSLQQDLELARRPDHRPSYAHVCGRCGAGAPWGFSTRRGTIWACSEHRVDGERLLDPPSPMQRGEPGGQ